MDWDYLKRSSLSVVAKYNLLNALIWKLYWAIGARICINKFLNIPKTPPTYPRMFIKLRLVL